MYYRKEFIAFTIYKIFYYRTRISTTNKQVIAVKECNMKTTKLYTTLVLIMTHCYNN